MKSSVLNYVETADERLLKLMEALAESYKNLDLTALLIEVKI